MLILIFRPFFGWSQHEKLRGHPLAQRAQQVCTEEASKVNEFFRQYGHTFKFQNQTYLVSYCVYTAATVDIQQIRHEDTQLAAAAANRLSTTLKMLESEARQTPGIKRSIDIIKSHLTQQQSEGKKTQKSGPAIPAPQGPSNLEIRKPPPPPPAAVPAPAPIPTPDYSQTSYSESTLPTPPPHNQLESPLSRVAQTVETVPSRLQAHPDPVGMIDPGRAHPLPGYEQIPDENIGSLMTQAMDVDNAWNDWDFFNAGGGFVPDSGSWAPAPFDPVYHFNMY